MIAQHARIHIIRRLPHGGIEVGGKWLIDDMIHHALRELVEYQAEEPNAGWRLEVCGDLGNWHEVKK